MCGYSITWNPRSNVLPFADATARTWNSPGAVSGAGFTRNRTVCDSSDRENFTACSAGDAVHPCGNSSFTTLSTGPGSSLTTVTRTSRSAGGGPPAEGGALTGGGVLAGRDAPAERVAPAGAGRAAPRPAGGGVGAGAGRAGRAGRIDAAGMIAISGVTRTDNDGTTSSSVRFSPLKMLPS